MKEEEGERIEWQNEGEEDERDDWVGVEREVETKK